MGFLEWLGEVFNPGPVGHIQYGSRPEDEQWQPKSKWVIWLITLLGVGFLGVLIYWITTSNDLLVSTIAAIVYLVVSWLFTPVPEHSNVGWAGGLINNPFRVSDNANRLLAVLAVILLPGKIIVYSVQTIFNTIRSH